MSTGTSPTTEMPKVLKRRKPEAALLRNEIWKRLHQDNEHFIGGVFGREGKGKSGTALSIASMVYPEMDVDHVMFKPGKLLKRIHEWKKEGTTKGRMIVADEAGVGLGNRTWYEKDQIKFAQVLQLIRSENMGILFTVPRGTEMDSQIRGGRLHAQFLINRKEEGKYVELEYENVRVGRRVDSTGLWTPKPEMNIGGMHRRLQTVRIGPPPQDLWEAYLERKEEFQSEEYKAAAEGMEDSDNDEFPDELQAELAQEFRNMGKSVRWIANNVDKIDYSYSWIYDHTENPEKNNNDNEID